MSSLHKLHKIKAYCWGCICPSETSRWISQWAASRDLDFTSHWSDV